MDFPAVNTTAGRQVENIHPGTGKTRQGSVTLGIGRAAQGALPGANPRPLQVTFRATQMARPC